MGWEATLQTGNFLIKRNFFKSQGAANDEHEDNARENSKNKIFTLICSVILE